MPFKVTYFSTNHENQELIYNFLLVINANLAPILLTLLSCTISKLWLIIGHIFASERECLTSVSYTHLTLPTNREV